MVNWWGKGLIYVQKHVQLYNFWMMGCEMYLH